MKQLPGYEDRNFYLEAFITETKSEETNSTASRRFVLKVFNSVTPQELAEGITSVLMHLKSRGIHCPVPVVSREGNTVLVLPEEEILQQDAAVIRSRRKPKFCTVLLTYISGMTLEKVAEPSPQLLYEVGKYVGEIDAALQVNQWLVLRPQTFLTHHLEHKTNRESEFSGLDWSTGLEQWTTGMEYWTTGMEYWSICCT